jgi:hypothetical protein
LGEEWGALTSTDAPLPVPPPSLRFQSAAYLRRGVGGFIWLSSLWGAMAPRVTLLGGGGGGGGLHFHGAASSPVTRHSSILLGGTLPLDVGIESVVLCTTMTLSARLGFRLARALAVFTAPPKPSPSHGSSSGKSKAMEVEDSSEEDSSEEEEDSSEEEEDSSEEEEEDSSEEEEDSSEEEGPLAAKAAKGRKKGAKGGGALPPSSFASLPPLTPLQALERTVRAVGGDFDEVMSGCVCILEGGLGIFTRAVGVLQQGRGRLGGREGAGAGAEATATAGLLAPLIHQVLLPILATLTATLREVHAAAPPGSASRGGMESRLVRGAQGLLERVMVAQGGAAAVAGALGPNTLLDAVLAEAEGVCRSVLQG